MSDPTLAYYNRHADEFAQHTQHADMRQTARRFLAEIPAGGHILDLGCGSGRDSLYFLQQGYLVTAVDGSEKLCRIAQEYTGQPVLCRDFFDITDEDEYDGIWACASLLHVEKERLPELLKKLSAALKPEGVLYVSFKEGEFSGIRSDRHFTDLTEESMREIFAGSGSWQERSVWKSCDVRPDHSGEVWINGLFHRG